jgi:hypothetical protein
MVEHESSPASSNTGFLTVEQCRASLPIKISRRALVRYIRAAGPGFYQEHRRQLFLTPEQWAAVVATIKPPERRAAGRRASSRSFTEERFAKLQARLRQADSAGKRGR